MSQVIASLIRKSFLRRSIIHSLVQYHMQLSKDKKSRVCIGDSSVNFLAADFLLILVLPPQLWRFPFICHLSVIQTKRFSKTLFSSGRMLDFPMLISVMFLQFSLLVCSNAANIFFWSHNSIPSWKYTLKPDMQCPLKMLIQSLFSWIFQ